MCACVYTFMRSENRFVELVLYFHLDMGLGLNSGMCSRYLYPLPLLAELSYYIPLSLLTGLDLVCLAVN